MTGAKGKEKASPLQEALDKFARTGGSSAQDPVLRNSGDAEATTSLVQVGGGLPAIPKKLIEKIEAGEYIDFSELPPAKGKGKSAAQNYEGQIVVVQAADLVQSRRLVPDLATWAQCFGLLTAVVARRQPQKVTDLMAYLAIVSKASQKYRWPSWVIYDQHFRMEAAGNPTQSWAKVDPSLYAQCFTGQARTAENWCSHCQGLDHSSLRCPFKPQKRSWGSAFGQPAPAAPGKPVPPGAGGTVCQKYNRFNGDCHYGKQCRYSHVCSRCGGPHPIQKCRAKTDSH